ncbi:pilus assembly protein [Fibrobacter sp. UWB2]|uniref:type II secretion system protein n=1 Tax=Fibrobacter sp. UWB2 TaxID=1964358 RepID=UPI000B524175|nr:type II secretion system protein [Fibrobacter sp. UWB2]OWV24402.1 pilus assembly protein [Fibrobacter sp. UWB2]
MKPMNSKRGITLMELMVVIAIMGILSTVAVPKLFGAGEKAREKIDLMKLYDLRNAINLALIEDIGAMETYDPVYGVDRASLSNRLNTALASDAGATLFVMELHQNYSMNVQGSHGEANDKYTYKDSKGKSYTINLNVCQMIGDAGTFYSALKQANFDGVAEIIAARLSNNVNNYKNGGDTYTAYQYKSSRGTFYRTTPKKQLFQSKALNIGPIDDNTRYTLNIRWTSPDDPYSVEVFLSPNKGTWETAYMSDNGTCFSTYGSRGCSKKN